jgi:hypothetical protein
MGAKEMGRKVVWVVAGVALLAVGTAAEVRAQSAAAAGTAMVVAYNAGQRGAVDVSALGSGGIRVVLAKTLKPGDAGAALRIRSGRVTMDIRLAGAGKARQLREPGKVLAGHAYCAYVGGPHRLLLVDVTDWLQRDASPAKVCRQAALAP